MILCKGVPLVNHGIRDHVTFVGKLTGQEPDVVLHKEVVVVVISASVTTDGGHKAGECMLLHCDPGGQHSDHGGQLDAGSRGHG